jgi:uncharacterized protein (TIGR02145 family)
MKRKTLRIILLVTTVTIYLSCSCEKENPILPDSPYNGKTTAIFNPDKKYGSVADIDGNVYRTIKIGNQVWMAENLRTTHFDNGDEIPNVTDNEEWAAQLSAAYCNYNNTTNIDTIANYGRMYNWYTVSDSRNLAPKGWRVASPIDWNTLVDYLGGDTIASNKMKEIGNYHWKDPYFSDNSSEFTALQAPFLYLYCLDSNVNKGFNYKNNGYAVRCIKE